jgi:hypothetical protein
MDTKSEITRLIAELLELRSEDWRLRYDEPIVEELGPPCSRGDLSVLERQLGAPLPPTYRAFLEIHDGWGLFQGEAKLLAVKDQHETWVKEALNNLSDLFDEFGEENPVKAGAFVAMLGQGSNWSLFLDPHKVDSRGEMEASLFDWTRLENRFADFGAYLANEVEQMREVVRSLKEGVADSQGGGA